jgi:hypothetical protein
MDDSQIHEYCEEEDGDKKNKEHYVRLRSAAIAKKIAEKERLRSEAIAKRIAEEERLRLVAIAAYRREKEAEKAAEIAVAAKLKKKEDDMAIAVAAELKKKEDDKRSKDEAYKLLQPAINFGQKIIAADERLIAAAEHKRKETERTMKMFQDKSDAWMKSNAALKSMKKAGGNKKHISKKTGENRKRLSQKKY